MKRLAFALLIMLSAATCTGAHGASRKLVIKVAAGTGPVHVGSGFGSVWVTGSGALNRIDPRTNATRVIHVGSDLCGLPRFAAGYVWVSACESPGTFQIDPRTNRVVRELNAISIGASGAGSLWLWDGSTGVVRLDPRSRLRLADIDPRVDISSWEGPFLVWHGFVWIYGQGDGSQSAISLIDVQTNKVARVIPLPRSKPSGAQSGGYFWGGFGAVADGKVWVTDPAGVYVIDPQTWTASRLSLRVTPLSTSGDADIAARGARVWTRVNDTTVVELSAADGRLIRRYAATGGGGGLDIAYGSLWVANSAADSIWRYPLS
jgi:hypothetical protein